MKRLTLILITAIVLLCMDVRAANCDAAIKKGNGECVDRTPKNQTYTRQPDVKMYGQIEMKVKWTEVKDTYTRTLQNDKGGSELKEFPVGEGASIVLTCTETVETAPVTEKSTESAPGGISMNIRSWIVLAAMTAS